MLMQGWLTVIIVYLLSLLSCAFCILFSPHLMNIKSVRYLQNFVLVYLRMRVLTGILVCVRLHESCFIENWHSAYECRSNVLVLSNKAAVCCYCYLQLALDVCAGAISERSD